MATRHRRTQRAPAIGLLLALAGGLCLTLAGGLFPTLSGSGTLGGASRLEASDVKVSRKEKQLVELGRRLFFDPVVSRSGARACASCHDPAHGFSDPAQFSDDDVGRTVRHSQTLLDSHLNPSAHWDGEFSSIEALVSARVGLTASERGYGASNSRDTLHAGHSSVPHEGDPIVGRDELGRVITPARGASHQAAAKGELARAC